MLETETDQNPKQTSDDLSLFLKTAHLFKSAAVVKQLQPKFKFPAKMFLKC